MKFKSNIESQAGIEDSAGSAGTDGKILSSLGVNGNGVAGVEWIDQGDVVAGEADKAKSVTLRVKNSTLSAMTKGQVICENVSISPPSGNLIEVALADNNAAGRMPALGILNEDLDASGGNNDEGDAIMFGKVSGIDTSAFQVGDEVFVSDAPGGLTTTKPTGVKYIQKVGVVIRDDNTNGTIEVFGAGRVNDVPTPLYVDHANQRLGIGVTNPGSKLTVDGTTHLGGDVEVSDGLGGDKTLTLNANIGHFSIGDIDGLGDQAFISGNSSSISISANQTTTLHCSSNNRVGIGTTSPSEKLVVRNGTSNTGVKILAYNSALGTEATLKFSTIASETNYEKAAIIARNAAGSFGRSDMHFALDSAPDTGNVQFSDTKMTILNGGNVGIGTTNPTKGLEVAGHVLLKNATFSYLYLQNTSNFLYGDNFGNTIIRSANNFRIQTQTNGGESVRVNSSGNVGINTTDPKTRLHVASANGSDTPTAGTATGGLFVSNTNKTYGINMGVSGSGWSFIQNQRADGNTTLYNLNLQPLGGNVGIGTTSPSYKLQVTGGQGDTLLFQVDEDQDAYLQIKPDAATTFKIGDINGLSSQMEITGDGSTLKFNGFGTNIMTITDDRRVGIGTTNPTAKTHIEQAIANGTTAYPLKVDVMPPGSNSFGDGTGISFGVGNNGSNRKEQARITVKQNYYGVRPSMSFDTLDHNSPYTDFISRMLIDPQGNVGINDNTPSYKLDVSGTGRFTDILRSDKLLQIPGAGTTANEAKGIGLNATEDFGYVGNDSTTRYLNHYGMGIHKPLQATMAGGNGAYLSGYFGVDIFTAGNSRIHVNQNGNVGIGSIAPAEKLDVVGNIKVSGDQYFNGSVIEGDGKEIIRYSDTWLRINEDKDFSNGIYCGSGILRTDGNFQVGASGTRLTVTTAGNVGIGETGPSSKLYIKGTTSTTSSQLMRIKSTTYLPSSPGRMIEFIRSNDSVRGYISMNMYGVQYNTTSDYRLKENITPINDALDRLNKLKPNRFSWKEGPSDYKVDGFIAHEVAEVIPEAVSGEKDAVDENNKPAYQGIDQAKIVPLLTAALQEAISKIEQLETRIQTLENK